MDNCQIEKEVKKLDKKTGQHRFVYTKVMEYYCATEQYIEALKRLLDP